MKHTKGQWYPVLYASFWNIQDGKGYGDNNLLDESRCPDAEANAKLAASAPDLLNALRILAAGLSKDKDMYTTAEKIKIAGEAIRNATV